MLVKLILGGMSVRRDIYEGYCLGRGSAIGAEFHDATRNTVDHWEVSTHYGSAVGYRNGRGSGRGNGFGLGYAHGSEQGDAFTLAGKSVFRIEKYSYASEVDPERGFGGT